MAFDRQLTLVNVHPNATIERMWTAVCLSVWPQCARYSHKWYPEKTKGHLTTFHSARFNLKTFQTQRDKVKGVMNQNFAQRGKSISHIFTKSFYHMCASNIHEIQFILSFFVHVKQSCSIYWKCNKRSDYQLYQVIKLHILTVGNKLLAWRSMFIFCWPSTFYALFTSNLHFCCQFLFTSSLSYVE